MAGKDFELVSGQLPDQTMFHAGDSVLVSRGLLAGLTGVVTGTRRNRRYAIAADGWPAGFAVVIGSLALKRLGPLD